MPIKLGSTPVNLQGIESVYWGNYLVYLASRLLTATGVSPLNLVNSVARKIKSLTQYGKCEQPPGTWNTSIVQYGKCVQNGTPTPDAPVDILCNNGVLRMVDDELPSGYKRLLGITFNGEVYYVTNYHMRGADTLRFSFKTTRDARNVLGCYNGSSATDNLSFYFNGGSLGVYLRYDGVLYRPVAYLNTIYNCVLSPTGVTGLSTDASWTETDFTSAAALFIGWLDNAASPKFIGDMYGSIVVDGRANFIPVERQSDGAIGYWDGQAFLENQGTGTPVSLGYDDSHYQLSVDGTPEMLMVRGINLLDPSTSNIVIGQYYNANGTSASVGGKSNWRSGLIPIVGGKTYAFCGRKKTDNTISAYNRINWYAADGTHIAPRPSYTVNTVTIATAPSNAAFAGLSCSVYDSDDAITRETFDEFNWMFAEASEEIPYQPYAAPQTVTDIPVLLGVGDYKDELEFVGGLLTHKVGVKVFDGTENWIAYTSSTLVVQNATSDWGAVAGVGGYCTHLTVLKAGETTFAGACRFATAFNVYEYKTAFGVADVAGFKAYLAAQYAAGTPVILVYPLATETTEQTTPHLQLVNAKYNTASVTAAVSDIQVTITTGEQTAPNPYSSLPIRCNNGELKWNGTDVVADGTSEVLTVRGKNLFDPTKVLFGYYRNITTGNQLQSPYNFMSSDGYYIPCLPNTAYTFAGINKTNGTYSKYNTIYFFDSAKNYLGASRYETSQPATDTTPSNCYYLQIRSNPLDTSSVTIQEAFSQFNWQLEQGSTATNYEPYVTPQTVTDIPMLLGVGVYKDAAELIQGIKTGKVGVKVLTGDADERWGYSQTSGFDRVNLALPDMLSANYGPGLCTHLERVNSVAEGIRFGASNSALYVYLNPTRGFSSAELWKAQLAAQYAAGTPVIVLYPLATETTEQGTPHDLSSYKGETIISVESAVDPVELSAEYYGRSG